MAWYRVQLEWEQEAPDKGFLWRFNKMLRKMDSAAPGLTSEGLDTSWRNMGGDLVLGILLNTLCVCDHPCRGRVLLEDPGEDHSYHDELITAAPWISGVKNLDAVRDRKDLAHLLAGFSRKTHPYLPGRSRTWKDGC